MTLRQLLVYVPSLACHRNCELPKPHNSELLCTGPMLQHSTQKGRLGSPLLVGGLTQERPRLRQTVDDSLGRNTCLTPQACEILLVALKRQFDCLLMAGLGLLGRYLKTLNQTAVQQNHTHMHTHT